MPYLTPSGRHERGSSLTHSNIIKNVVVQEALKSFQSMKPDDSTHVIDENFLVPSQSFDSAKSPRKYIFSFDGSSIEVADDDKYPSQKICYIQIAGVFIDLDLLEKQKDEEFVDPKKVQDSIETSASPFALPSCFKIKKGCDSVRNSWRAEIFRYFKEYEVQGIPLLQTYWKLVKSGAAKYDSVQDVIFIPNCPANNCDWKEPIKVPINGTVCPVCNQEIYPTDALRIHEEVNEALDNQGAANRLMICLEHLTMVSYIEYLRDRRMIALSRAAFFIDGPLAIMGPPAWLHHAIHVYIKSLNDEMIAVGYPPPVIIGLEKSGAFVDHGNAIRNLIQKRQLMLLPDEYIYKFILPSKERRDSYYGQETYYGQKFYYKTEGEQLLTITISPRNKGAEDRHLPKYYQFVLPDILELLDKVGTAFRRDAVIPVELAHNAASIPLRTGTKVLRLLSKRMSEEGCLEPAHIQEDEE